MALAMQVARVRVQHHFASGVGYAVVSFGGCLGAVAGLFELENRSPLVVVVQGLLGLLRELVHHRDQHGRCARIGTDARQRAARLRASVARPLCGGGHPPSVRSDRGTREPAGRRSRTIANVLIGDAPERAYRATNAEQPTPRHGSAWRSRRDVIVVRCSLCPPRWNQPNWLS